MSPAERPWTEAGFLLGEWEIKPRHGTLARPGDSAPVQLEPRVMAVLVCLAHHAGEVVTRDEFIKEVWGGRVVSDEALSRCISLLRQVLHDDSREPRFIRTVSRIGYTLLVEPAPLPSQEPAHTPTAAIAAAAAASPGSPAATAPVEPAPAPAAASQGPAFSRRLRYMALAIVLLLGAGTLIYMRRPGPSTEQPPPPLTRLLLLPFDTHAAKDFGRDVGNELADELADSLARVPGLVIIGRTTAHEVAKSTDPIAAARGLGADAVVSGAVADNVPGIQISVRFDRTADSGMQWGQVYATKSTDILALETRIVREVLDRVAPGHPEITGPEPETRDVEAYWLFLRGQRQLRLRGEDSLHRAVDLFAAALRRDPGYARPQAGIATAYALLPSYTHEDPKELYALADKALQRVEQLTGSHTLTAGTHALIEFQRWKWKDAEAAFRTAITTDPNNSELRQTYSQLLGAVGRLDAALEQAQLAREIDPLAPVISDRIGVLRLWLGQDDEAARDFTLAKEFGLDESAYPETKVLLNLHRHLDAEAAEKLRSLQQAVDRPTGWIAPTLSAYRHPDERKAAVAMLDRAQKSGELSPRLYFGSMVILESPERAIRAFTALIDHDANDLEFMFSTDAAAARRDPGFGEFARGIGLEAYWDRYGWPAACKREGAHITCH
jgi:DNA-binding winged helix-turn-helix (wHTH) protein/TolB-like protein/tetratricopeptide (TPR) repeat protein